MRDIFYIKFKQEYKPKYDVGMKYNFNSGQIKNIIEDEYYISNYISNNIIKSLFDIERENDSETTYILCPKYTYNNDIQIGVTGKCLKNENKNDGLEREVSEEIGFYFRKNNNIKLNHNNFIINFDKTKEEDVGKIKNKIKNFKKGEDDKKCKISTIIYSNNLESLIKYYKNNFSRSGNNSDNIDEVCFVNLSYIINTIKTIVLSNKIFIDSIEPVKNIMKNSYNILQNRKIIYNYIKNKEFSGTNKLNLVLYTNDKEEFKNMEKLGKEMSDKVLNVNIKSVFMYTLKGCPSCEKSKKLLDNSNIKYNFEVVSAEDKNKNNVKFKEKFKIEYKYYPKIIINNNNFIGGFTELKKLFKILNLIE